MWLSSSGTVNEKRKLKKIHLKKMNSLANDIKDVCYRQAYTDKNTHLYTSPSGLNILAEQTG